MPEFASEPPTELAQALRQVQNLTVALQTNRDIAMATGFLMGSRGLDQDDAFDLLVKASQHRRVKLHEIACQVLEVRQLASDGTTTHSQRPGRQR